MSFTTLGYPIARCSGTDHPAIAEFSDTKVLNVVMWSGAIAQIATTEPVFQAASVWRHFCTTRSSKQMDYRYCKIAY
jgi:hypothetical protein